MTLAGHRSSAPSGHWHASTESGRSASRRRSSPGRATVRPDRPQASSIAALRVAATATCTARPRSAAARRSSRPMAHASPSSRSRPLTSSVTRAARASTRGENSRATSTSAPGAAAGRPAAEEAGTGGRKRQANIGGQVQVGQGSGTGSRRGPNPEPARRRLRPARPAQARLDVEAQKQPRTGGRCHWRCQIAWPVPDSRASSHWFTRAPDHRP